MKKPTSRPRKKLELTLHRETLRLLAIKSHIKAGPRLQTDNPKWATCVNCGL